MYFSTTFPDNDPHNFSQQYCNNDPSTPSSAGSSNYGLASSHASSSNLYGQANYSPALSPMTPSQTDPESIFWSTGDNQTGNNTPPVTQDYSVSGTRPYDPPVMYVGNFGVNGPPFYHIQDPFVTAPFGFPDDTLMPGAPKPQDAAAISPQNTLFSQDPVEYHQSPAEMDGQGLGSPFFTPTKPTCMGGQNILESSPSHQQFVAYNELKEETLNFRSPYGSTSLITPSPTSRSFSEHLSMKFDESPISHNDVVQLPKISTKDRRRPNRNKKIRFRRQQMVTKNESFDGITISGSNRDSLWRCQREECLMMECPDHQVRNYSDPGCPRGKECKHPEKRVRMEEDGERPRSRFCFKRQEHLKRHTVSHSNLREAPCPIPICPKHLFALGRGDNLKAHMRTHLKTSGRNKFCPSLVKKYAPNLKFNANDYNGHQLKKEEHVQDDGVLLEEHCLHIETKGRPCDKCQETLSKMKGTRQSRL
ncbi:MAG: hypothetical protein M1814_001456 [Vezdaea aestivalis]|nr:MAG: hypothetical protein M1814_001456 [Vezdaea aestivalis]